MKYVGQGTVWGIAQRLWVVIGITMAAGCSSGLSGDLAGEAGGGGNGGSGGVGGHPNTEFVVGHREAALPESFDQVSALAPTQQATACTAGTQCPTGYCVDGVCCDSKCDNKCMACSAAKKGSGADGVCGSIAYDTDPDNDCPYGACDGKNMCKNYNGVACTAAAQCLSNYCIDGFCCNNTCMLSCQACSAAKKGGGTDGICGAIAAGTDPDNECNPGECTGSLSCNSSPQPQYDNGHVCTSAAMCKSGYCADGVCCDTICLGTCMACTAAKKFSGADGTCGNIAYDKDPDEECWGGACNGSGVCKQYNGVPCTSTTQCLSNYCVDGFCCGNTCQQFCYACSEAKKGQGYDGVCEPIAFGRDIEGECNPGECNGGGLCTQPQTPLANGGKCVSGGMCASGYCIDGVCCDTACADTCKACSAAKKGSGVDGTCGLIGSELDPDNECNGGRCDGKGVCRYYNGGPCSSTGQCFSNYCVDGFCCNNVCVGPCQACSTAKKGNGYNGVCGNIAGGTDPDNECNPGECSGSGACNQTQANLPLGTVCTLATQCASGYCVDGVCCDNACVGNCVACTVAKAGQGKDGTCSYVKAGVDTENECANGDCNGSGGCTAVTNLPNGSTCTAANQCASNNCVDGYCCNTACTGLCVACSVAKMGQGTNGTCGPIKYDTDPDEECYGGGCTGTGSCGYYNGVPCAQATQCLSNYCVDGFCCNNHCGGTCYACSTTKKGSGYDGICGLIKANTDPDNECAGASVCGGSGTCTTVTCATNADCGSNATCSNTVCICNSGYSGDGYTCTDINECATNNGGCSTNATCTNTPGSRTCACNTGYTGDGITCADVNECATNNGGCSANATCTNTPGSRTCACNTGYTGDGITCTDVNECATNNGGCSANATCTNTPGSRTCACNAGYSGDGITCTDINECAMNNGGCDANATCTNTPGSRTCACNAGYSGDGITCTQTATIVAIKSGGGHNCALASNGNLKCWGDNTEGALGVEDTNNRGDAPGEMSSALPVVNLGNNAKALALGNGHSCAILNDDTVKCWGKNNAGQLGFGDTAYRGDSAGTMGASLPTVDVGTGQTAAQIVAGNGFTCARLTTGNVKCWGSMVGYGDTNVRGDNPGEMGDSLATIDLGTGKTASQIAAGDSHVCALLNDSTIKCWGSCANGRCGIGETGVRGDAASEMGDNLPAIDLGTGRTAKAITAGGSHTCAILDNDTVKCWGTGAVLGLGVTDDRGDAAGEMGDALPNVDLGGMTATAIGAGFSHTCALLSDSTVKCWGVNANGELGQGNTNTLGDQTGEMGSALPAVDLGAGASVVILSVGYNANCAILTNGSLKCWGKNTFGTLGLGDTNSRGDQPSEMGSNLPLCLPF